MLVGTFSLNQWVEFYLNNTINLRPLTLCHVIPTKWRSYRGHGYCEVTSPNVYLGILWYALQAFQRSIFSNLFARRQQRCGLWLPVLKQFVYLFNWEATVCVRCCMVFCRRNRSLRWRSQRAIRCAGRQIRPPEAIRQPETRNGPANDPVCSSIAPIHALRCHSSAKS